MLWKSLVVGQAVDGWKMLTYRPTLDGIIDYIVQMLRARYGDAWCRPHNSEAAVYQYPRFHEEEKNSSL